MKKTTGLLCSLFFLALLVKGQSPITWNSSTNLAPATSGNEHPRMALDASGNPLVIWHHVSRCMFSRWNGTSFTTPVLLNTPDIAVAGASWMGPDIAAHGDTVYVVFKQTPESSDAAHIFCVHSYDGGVSFSQPIQVDDIQDSLSRFPTITTDAIGNPVIGFMKFNPSFGDSRWAVTRSDDFGNTFSIDVKASGWSSANATVCDCCPGSITCSDNTVAMVYRDNNVNIRDSWAGISTDNATTFSGGIGIDQQNWQLNACPATGPDAVMIGDTLFSTFANGASGKSLVYFNKTSVPDMTSPTSQALTGLFSGLSQQNYPRIASDGTALAVAWMQVVNGAGQCVMRFTNDYKNGFPAAYDTVDLNNITNCDVAVGQGKVYVVWEDDNAGTIKYRAGTFAPATSGIQEPGAGYTLSVFPNPTRSEVHVSSDGIIDKILIVNLFGQVVCQEQPKAPVFSANVEMPGIYFAAVTVNGHTSIRKLVVAR